MDDRLAKLIDNDTPQLTREIADGVATYQLKHVERDIDELWKSASASFIEGLTYHGIKRCDPYEIFKIMTQPRSDLRSRNKNYYEISNSNVFMIKVLLKYNGEKLRDIHLWLPNPQDGGIIEINGAKWAISPVLNDIVFSAANDYTIFMRLPRSRVNFERLQHVISHNAQTGLDELPEKEIVQVVHSRIHQSKDKPALSGRTTLIHYLLAKHGFEEMFNKLVGFVPEIDHGNSRINTTNYNPKDWVIVGTSGQKPRACPRVGYKPSDLRIAVPREEWKRQSVRNLLAGFFYVVDHFPDRLILTWIFFEKNPTRIWKILLGLLIYSASNSEELLHERIVEHFRSLDYYVDFQASKKLTSIGLGHIKDFYELLWHITETFNEKLLHFSHTLNSMYDKELNVNDFVLQDINNGIFNSVFKLTQRQNMRAANRGPLTKKDVESILRRELKPDLIFRITKDTHGEVTPTAISNDNKALRLTTMLLPQSANDSKRRKKLNLNDPAIRYHPSVAEVGGYTVLSKSSPDGRRRLNPCVKLDEAFKIVRREEFRPLLDDVEKLTSRNTK